jgi:hypothetical protein
MQDTRFCFSKASSPGIVFYIEAVVAGNSVISFDVSYSKYSDAIPAEFFLQHVAFGLLVLVP